MPAWPLLILAFSCLSFSYVLGDSILKVAPWSVRHDFSCQEIRSIKWTRRVCFGKISRETQEDPEAREFSGKTTPTSRIGLLCLAVTIDTTPENGFRQSTNKTCGDTIRARFVSEEGLVWFASVGEVQLTCRSYKLIFEPPPHPGKYWLEFRLIHIDGEGMLDPNPELGWGQNILGDTEAGLRGPPIYNLLIRITGRLQVLPVEPNRRKSKDSQSCSSLQAPAPLPRCTRGDHRGRWTGVDDPLYPPFEGEPIHWLPYGCRYRVHTTQSLAQCLRPKKAPPRVLFVGESIMQQMYLMLMTMLEGDLWGMKTERGLHYWPPYFKFDSKVRQDVANPRLQLEHHHGLGLAIPALKTQVQSWNREPSLRPDILVFLCAHNDMMRRSMALYADNLNQLVSILTNDARFPGHIVWITAPTRLYKASGGNPGECRCPGGRSSDCGRESADPHCLCTCGMLIDWVEEKMDTSWDDAAARVVDYPWFPTHAAIHHKGIGRVHTGGRLSWENVALPTAERAWRSGAAPLVHNTYPRVKWANDKAVQVMKKAFPGRIHIVDFSALTDALTPDYCFDGLHWSCERLHVQERAGYPWPCRNLANAAVTNILANVLCSIIPKLKG